MQKHPRITFSSKLNTCTFSNQALMQPIKLSPFAFNRHLRKSAIAHIPAPGIKVYKLPCGCFVWAFKSGIRQLSALPF